MRGLFLTSLVLIAAAFYSFTLDKHSGSDIEHQIGTVESVDNSTLTVVGTAKIGTQKLNVRLSNHQLVETENLLTGAMEYDEYYQPGDRVVLAHQQDRYHAVALFRLPVLIGLMLLFAVGLLGYARKVGLYALLSFIGSIAIVFGFLIPGLLAGYSPILITALTLFILSSMIILSVAGWTYKGKAALSGTIIGLIVTAFLCEIVGKWLHLDGMNQPLAQPLMFENGMRLNMIGILYAAILVGASGAAMDVAMEMAATMEELKINSPSMSRGNLLKSGLRVGNAVIGTMTTTLLLAYAGSFLTLLMLFATRGNNLMQILNMKLVASEICRTLIGSLSLIIVAPTTAWIASFMLTKPRHSVDVHTISDLSVQKTPHE